MHAVQKYSCICTLTLTRTHTQTHASFSFFSSIYIYKSNFKYIIFDLKLVLKFF
uniref:Uncharacterized protein n=1 Tax=Oryza brachyantha TaxID=4533 RepID=J3N427_ORYBR